MDSQLKPYGDDLTKRRDSSNKMLDYVYEPKLLLL